MNSEDEKIAKIIIEELKLQRKILKHNLRRIDEALKLFSKKYDLIISVEES